jgi:predicted lipoprotein with Yx(FWY)xxD motif
METETEMQTDTGTGTEQPTDEGTETPTTGTMAATVSVGSHPDLGSVLVDSAGMTLYMFDQDTKGAGSSTCSGGCAESWPPLTVEGEPMAGDDVTAALTTFERGGDEMQVAAGGWPLYYFAGDEEPGDANGQGVNEVWWVLRPDGTPVKPGGGEGTQNDPYY